MADLQPGERIGVGRTSEVFAYGEHSVVKVPHLTLPSDWTVFEAEIARGIHAAGLPVPEVRDVIDVNGRPAAVFERIEGPSMWQRIVAQPDESEALIAELASMQRALLAGGIPTNVPDFVDRLVRRISIAEPLSDADRGEATALAQALPRGAALLHGDLHPGNVLMSSRGPIVIDWFDAAIGHPIADLVRTSILMRPGSGHAPDHLPGATPALLERLHAAYIAQFADELADAATDLASWQAAVAVGRLAEGAEVDEGWLIQLWHSRHTDRAAEFEV